MAFKLSALQRIDSYKLGHQDQYPAGITQVYSNLTPRKKAYFNEPEGFKLDKIVWFGLQAFIIDMMEVWQKTFFDKSKTKVCREFKQLVTPFTGPNGFDTKRIAALHDLGYLPLQIKSLPEGSLVPYGVPVMTITNTLPEFYWLPNFMETWLSADLWKVSSAATTAFAYRRILATYANQAGTSQDFILWQGHDFSPRGMSGMNDAAHTGMGHLTSFWGTDNIPAVAAAKHYYGGDFIYGSVPATEHSVMCAGGDGEDEYQTYLRLLNQYPSGIVSIVSDTWDLWKVLTDYTVRAKDIILNRKDDAFGNAKVVFRPDSGDPVKIITGYRIIDVLSLNDSDVSAAIDNPEFEGYIRYAGDILSASTFNGKIRVDVVDNLSPVIGAVKCLHNVFGGTVNDKGLITLDRHVGLIYGDSITMERAKEISERLIEFGFTPDNCVFGIGSYTYNFTTRDAHGFAMKATWVRINEEGKAIYKDPVTDDGTKKSARGLLKVVIDDDQYKLLNDVSEDESHEGELKIVFQNGVLVRRTSMFLIRDRLNNELEKYLNQQ